MDAPPVLKCHKNKKFVQADKGVALRKNGGYTPSDLGSRLIIVVSQPVCQPGWLEAICISHCVYKILIPILQF